MPIYLDDPSLFEIENKKVKTVDNIRKNLELGPKNLTQSEIWSMSFDIDNMHGSDINRLNQGMGSWALGPSIKYKEDENFDADEYLTSIGQERISEMGYDIKNKEYADTVVKYVQDLEYKEAMLGEAGWSAVPARMVTSVADVSSLVPGMIAVKAAKAGKVIKGAAGVGAVSAVEFGAQTAYLSLNNPSITKYDIAMNAAIGGAVGSIVGAAGSFGGKYFSARAKSNMTKEIHAQVKGEKVRYNIDEPGKMTNEVTGEVHIKDVDNPHEIPLRTRAVNNILTGGPVARSPSYKGLTHESDIVKDFTDNFLDHNFITKRIREGGQKRDHAVGLNIHAHRSEVELLRYETLDAYSAYKKRVKTDKGKPISFPEFEARGYDLYHGKKELLEEIPELSFYENKHRGMLQSAMKGLQDVKILDESVNVKDFENVITRDYLKDAIIKEKNFDKSDFLEVLKPGEIRHLKKVLPELKKAAEPNIKFKELSKLSKEIKDIELKARPEDIKQIEVLKAKRAKLKEQFETPRSKEIRAELKKLNKQLAKGKNLSDELKAKNLKIKALKEPLKQELKGIFKPLRTSKPIKEFEKVAKYFDENGNIKPERIDHLVKSKRDALIKLSDPDVARNQSFKSLSEGGAKSYRQLLKARTIHATDEELEGYLHKDMTNLVAKTYMSEMTAVELTKGFKKMGYENAAELKKAIKEEMELKLKDNPGKKDYVALTKDANKLVDDIIALNAGTLSKGDPWYLKTYRGYVSGATLENVLKASISDVWMIPFRHGFGKAISKGLLPMLKDRISNNKAWKRKVQDMQQLGVAMEIGNARMFHQLTDAVPGQNMERQNIVSRSMTTMGEYLYKFAGMDYWMQGMREIGANTILNTYVEAGRTLAKGGKLNKHLDRRFREIGLSNEDILNMYNESKKFGEYIPGWLPGTRGVWVPNVKVWNKEVLEKAKRATIKDVDSSIVLAKQQDTPLWLQEYGPIKTIFQLSSFPLNAVNQIATRAVDQNMLQGYMAIGGMVMTAGTVQYLWNEYVTGKSGNKNPLKDPEVFFAEGVLRSGVGGKLLDMASAYADIGTRYGGSSFSEKITGPGISMLDDAVEASKLITNRALGGSMTKADARKIKNIIAGYDNPILKPLIDPYVDYLLKVKNKDKKRF